MQSIKSNKVKCMTVDDKTISSSRIAESKFLRVFMVALSVLLIFVGPTYIPYLMSDFLKLDLVISSLTGLVDRKAHV